MNGWWMSIFLLVLLLPLANASTNNVQMHYAFDEDFQDTTNLNDMDDPFCVAGCPIIVNRSKIGNGSMNVTLSSGVGGVSGSFMTLPASVSIAAWVNATTTSANVYPIFSFDNNTVNNHFIFRLFANRSIGLRIENISNAMPVDWIAVDAPAVTLNNWTHIGVTVNENSPPLFYINGVQYTSTNASGPASGVLAYPKGSSLQTRVGAERTFSDADTFRGNIDDVAVWFKILTSSDFTALYNAGAGAEYPYSSASDINFTPSYNSSENLAVTTKITMQENSSDFVYKYALTCDLERETLWNELFNTFYNFTTQNVSTSFTNPESYLTFNGIEWENIEGVTMNFDLVKNANQAYRDFLVLELQYQTSADHYADFIAYDEDNNPALYLTLNKTGSTLIVGNYNPNFGINNNIANFTLTGGSVALEIQLTPHHDSGTNTDDFEFTIKNNNQTGTQTSTDYGTIAGAANIQDVELFVGNRFNGTTFYKRISLTKTSDPFPDFVQFQNGEREVIGGITFETPPPQSSISGDGFTIIPDFNNIFYSICQYSSTGAKTQRHFIAETNSVDDWNNFVDLVITAAQVSTNTSEDTEGGAAGPGSGDIGTDLIPSFFESIGFTSTASKLFIWFIIVLIVSAFAFGVHPLFGMGVFVGGMIIGYPIGMVPIWFVVMFTIVCAGIIAITFKYIFAK